MTEQNQNFTFDTLSPEEKRRVIAALSMGKLSEEEKREFAQACAASRLTEEEQKQIKKAFMLSRMTDEERRALLLKRKQASASAASPAASDHAKADNGGNGATRTIPLTQETKKKDAETPKNTQGEKSIPEDMPTTEMQAATVRKTEEARRSEDIRRSGAGKKEAEPVRDEDDEHDTTAITSLLKGVVYIVAVLIVSVFASYAIISIGNDVFAFVKSTEAVTVTIEEDMTAKQVSEMLYANGIIKYPTVYELFIRLKKYPTNYLVGEYEISPSMNYKQINRAFTYIDSTKTQVVVTIPEGYTIDQMIDLFLSYGIGTKEGFADAINNYEFEDFRFIDELPQTLDRERKYRLEGYLFPDTYFFFTDDSEVAVIYKLLQNFQRKITDEYYDRASEMGMTMDQVITLASMLEAEGSSQSDYENISSVFHNRLDHAREYPLLQSDATLQYILDKRKTALTASDLKIDSKYNSYLYPGLPPSAICNPGLDAIDCALYPANTKYYYFLADSRGNTYFSETLEEHEALKAEYINNR